jgi:hypothetical protein
VREQRTAASAPLTERRHAEKRRPQVRYHYYRNGREVSFSEAFR